MGLRVRPATSPAVGPLDQAAAPGSGGLVTATHKSVDRQVADRQRLPFVEGDLQRIVGQNLRAYREAKGLSQEAFADVLGFHRTYVGGLERGERNLTLKAVERIAGRLEMEPLALLAARA